MSDRPNEKARPQPAAQNGHVDLDMSNITPDCVAREPHPYTARELAWHPNAQGKGADKWFAAHNDLKDKPLDTDGNGFHKVVYGDDLSTIAMRSLRDQGKGTARDDIRKEEARIVGLNVQAFPGMEKNPELLRDGMLLRMADCNGAQPVQLPPDAPQRPQAQPKGPDKFVDDGDIPQTQAVPQRRPAPAPQRYPQRAEAPPPPGPPPGGYRQDAGYYQPAPVAAPVQQAYAPQSGYNAGWRPDVGSLIGGAAIGVGLSALFGGFGRHHGHGGIGFLGGGQFGGYPNYNYGGGYPYQQSYDYSYGAPQQVVYGGPPPWAYQHRRRHWG